MSIKKYKYYFKKPRSEITKDIFKIILVTGALTVASTSPYFAKNIIACYKQYKKSKKHPPKKVIDTFYNLKRHGLIDIKNQNRQIYISLTEKGREKANWMQINDLKIKNPRKWDKKWRLVIFDISELKRLHREAFRGKLKELGFCQLQKSIWICPFDCRAEIELLKNFFGLSDNELRIITAENIGDDAKFKKLFNL